jgi:beta-glucosidase
MADHLDALYERARELAATMTDDEKLSFLAGLDFWHSRPVDRLGIPSIRMADGPHGLTVSGDIAGPGTCFPTGVCIGSTWSTDVAREVGAAIAREARSRGCSVLLGPSVDLHRGPLNGRNYESYSEDPLLAGKLAASYVRGAQEEGIACCIKHFTCNNQQTEQAATSSEVDERTLREIYLPAFAEAVRSGGVWAVMTAYNLVNGEHCSENRHLVTDMLKGDLGHRGPVLSDWRGVHSTRAAEAGLDLEMPGPGNHLTAPNLRKLVDSGRLSMAAIGDSVVRLVAMVLWTREHADRKGEIDSPRHRALARRVAAEGIVLLKNEGGLLPLDRRSVRSLAVIGPNAAHARLGGGGSSAVTAFYEVSPLQGLRSLAGGLTTVRYEEGCSLIGTLRAVESERLRPSPGAPPGGLRARYHAGSDSSGNSLLERVDPAIDFSWGWASPGGEVPRDDYTVLWEGEIQAEAGGTHQLGLSAEHGAFRLWLDGKLLLDRRPTGDSFEERYASRAQTEEVDLQAGKWYPIRIEYRKTGTKAAIRLEWQPPGAEDSVARAERLASECDAAVVVVGLSNRFEGGNNDRTALEMPGRQDELVERVVAANPHTVVVLVNGSPVSVERWIDRVPAVLEAWYPGQEGGNAIAEVLFGEANPSGRLPDTLPRRLEDTPCHGDFPGSGGKVRYREGVFVGYRHYDERRIAPRFPFGHGLSYTSFAYRGLRAAPAPEGEAIEVAVEVTNTGRRRGQEVVQVWVAPPASSRGRPPKELRAFGKIDLAPGQARSVRFMLGPEAFARFDPGCGSWRVEPGEYHILVGGRPDCLAAVAIQKTGGELRERKSHDG